MCGCAYELLVWVVGESQAELVVGGGDVGAFFDEGLDLLAGQGGLA